MDANKQVRKFIKSTVSTVKLKPKENDMYDQAIPPYRHKYKLRHCE
jgi:hypothetical protein